MVKYWRSQGHIIILYLDDGWGIESNFNICKAFADRLRQTWSRPGFSLTKKKVFGNLQGGLHGSVLSGI
jgi:hypothetical protein